MCGDLTIISPTIISNNTFVKQTQEFHPSGKIYFLTIRGFIVGEIIVESPYEISPFARHLLVSLSMFFLVWKGFA